MLSLISKFKNKISDTFNPIIYFKRRKPYTVTESVKRDIITNIISVIPDKPMEDNDKSADTIPIEKPESTCGKKECILFNTKITESELNNENELQELLKTMHELRINLTNLILEPRIEEMIEKIPNASSIMKVKLRIIYIIIAHDIYSTLFKEKKHYHSLRSTRYLGVFHYNNYIIRIDDSPYSFINESDVINALIMTTSNVAPEETSSRIITPFIIYKNIRFDSKNNICECNPKVYCECKYHDDAGNLPGMDNMSNDALICYNKMRKDAISFSIQYYVNNTIPLYNWVRENMGNYNQFSTIQHPFFIYLFYQCAELFQILHNANIVHGDVKPDNILIREHSDFNLYHQEKCKCFTVYLIDFGLSGIEGKGYGTGGTIPYCHPEFKNIQDTNKSSKYNWKMLRLKHDIWSLGLGFLTMYIYRDYYNYYYKYPKYFFTKNGYISQLILDVITHSKLNSLFTKMMSEDCIPIREVCDMLKDMSC